MSDWRLPRKVIFHGNVGAPDHWRLRVYEIVAHGVARRDATHTIDAVRHCVATLDAPAFSDEFEYLHFGFANVHYGRRGVTVSVYHVGRWTDIPEVFIADWYSYGHEALELERLDFREPLASLPDIPVVAFELEQIAACLESVDTDGAKQWSSAIGSYLARPGWVGRDASQSEPRQ